jgi:hypothetical protein
MLAVTKEAFGQESSPTNRICCAEGWMAGGKRFAVIMQTKSRRTVDAVMRHKAVGRLHSYLTSERDYITGVAVATKPSKGMPFATKKLKLLSRTISVCLQIGN